MENGGGMRLKSAYRSHRSAHTALTGVRIPLSPECLTHLFLLFIPPLGRVGL
jgi:hypothetical protein